MRTCEHLLDVVAGRADADAAYAGETLTRGPALDALQDALPALQDLRSRTWTDASIYGCASHLCLPLPCSGCNEVLCSSWWHWQIWLAGPVVVRMDQ